LISVALNSFQSFQDLIAPTDVGYGKVYCYSCDYEQTTDNHFHGNLLLDIEFGKMIDAKGREIAKSRLL
jgi:hypothetical protein